MGSITNTIIKETELGLVRSLSPMPNGEVRVRLMRGHHDGSYGYIMTIMPEGGGGWQNSHYHERVMETYIVQEGWIGYAVLTPTGKAQFFVYRAGELFTTRSGEVHNVYMPAGAVIHTVKHGDCSLKKDWIGSSALDTLTKTVSERDLLRLASGS